MLHYSSILLAMIMFLPALRSQCVNCTEFWHSGRLIDETGYFCERGASISEVYLKEEDYATSTPNPNSLWATCVPYPYRLEHVAKYCCFWSQNFGCNAAIGVTIYPYGNPVRFCEKCRNKCSRPADSVGLAPTKWFIICCMSIMRVL
ncbi:uncharacterized protein LOC132790419 isoform X1 [Drosophila nasuta]|uniref:uncharacterized protein LOC132790419 isoform X1 n=1 Tax=Drosophila nasuta TaxID=42062 RepID=UPI00295E8D65|nr:uncharacterized protein LOC132790419 isoform X1 [Drosophila nasuta]